MNKKHNAKSEVVLSLRCMFCGKEGTAKVSNKYKYDTSKGICPSCNGEENEWGCTIFK